MVDGQPYNISKFTSQNRESRCGADSHCPCYFTSQSTLLSPVSFCVAMDTHLLSSAEVEDVILFCGLMLVSLSLTLVHRERGRRNGIHRTPTADRQSAYPKWSHFKMEFGISIFLSSTPSVPCARRRGVVD